MKELLTRPKHMSRATFAQIAKYLARPLRRDYKAPHALRFTDENGKQWYTPDVKPPKKRKREESE